MLRKNLVFSLLAVFSSVSTVAVADGRDGFANIFNMIFGSEQARNNVASCKSDDENKGEKDLGFLGHVDMLFCHVGNDMGIKTPGTYTKTFTRNGSSSSMTVKASWTQPANGTLLGGVTYTDLIEIWVCPPTSDCTKASSFGQVAYAAFTKASDISVNKGYVLMDPGVFEKGTSGTMAFLVTYDLAKGKAGTVTVQGYYNGGSGNVFEMYASGSKSTANVLSVQSIMSSPMGAMRFDGKLDRTNKSGCVYFEGGQASGSGTGSYSASASGDTPSGMSFTYTPATGVDDNHRDNSYTAGSGSCTLDAMPNVKGSDVAAYTWASVSGGHLSDTPGF